ncbi:MAG: Gfo/Idh/MocA family oxidoreductase [Planctomycetota bacterium]|nr:MAG: Gfo/Idh/MocA family oxidoreductase [Planctomycetota bacterium]
MKGRKKTTDKRNGKISRRDFMQGAAGAAVAFTIVPRHVLGGAGNTPPSEKLNIAGIGIGGQGADDLSQMESENIVALCDVDEEYAAETFNKYPKAKKYRDFRRMLEKQKDIEAVVVATPDHTHAIISMGAIKAGKHVYCEKPLTHTIYEARAVTKAAREAKVATQMGNQHQAIEGPRLLCEWIWDGAIGPVREVHVWTYRPAGMWPQGVDRPKDTPALPSTLDWDLWLGTAPYRPYHPDYVPFKWRGWYDFGTGTLGDMGSHNLAPIFQALKLKYPTSVEAVSTEMYPETYPLASMVRYEFPARGDMPPVKITWYDSGLMPFKAEELEDIRLLPWEDGIVFVGDKGKLVAEGWGAQSVRLIPETKMKEYQKPPKTLPRSIGHYKEWVKACKDGTPTGSDFEFASLVTETCLLGNIAIRTGTKRPWGQALIRKKLNWDGLNMKFTNVPEANEYIHRQYREGWML